MRSGSRPNASPPPRRRTVRSARRAVASSAGRMTRRTMGNKETPVTEPLSSNICTFYTQDGIHRPEKYVDGKRCQCGYRPSNEQRTSNHQLNVTLALDAIKHNIILSTAEQKALAAEIERLTRELTTLSTCYAAANTAFRV